MEKYYALPQDRIIEELKEENQRLTQRIKELEDHIENSQYDHVRNYEKYEDDDVVWDMTDIDKDWDEIFQS